MKRQVRSAILSGVVGVALAALAAVPAAANQACVGFCRDQNLSGSDLGNCIRACETTCHDPDSDRSYVSADSETCLVIRFLCVEGYVPFFDVCGCGCELE